jgi:hypothetical protein
MAREPEIAVAVRTFGNSKMQEGIRVKAGTRFAVGNPQGNLRVITIARYRQLLATGLVRPLGLDDVQAAPSADDPSASRAGRPVHEAAGQQIAANREADKPKGITAETLKRPSTREAARRRTLNPEPPAPKRLDPPPAAPNGSQNGQTQSASSSAADPASNTSGTTSRRRGRRQA